MMNEVNVDAPIRSPAAAKTVFGFASRNCFTAPAMTAAVWGLALAGAFIKLRYPQRLERVDLGLYLGLGWLILIAWEPFLAVVDPAAAALIMAGGVFYTIGAGFHAWRALRFQNAIWHGFVLAAAACHYAAVLRGVAEQ